MSAACEGCGKGFAPRRGKRFCGQVCKQRAHRQRFADGLVYVPFDRVDLEERLISVGILSSNDRDDAAALVAAVQAFVLSARAYKISLKT